MKGIMKGAIGGQEGNVLILVLILLVVGGLILAPMLGLMSTGLIAGQVYEKKTDELYAADAGVEDACWQLKQTDPDPSKIPTTPEEPPLTYSLQPLNDKEIEVTIGMISGTAGDGIYKVTSTATSIGGSDTTIVSYVQTMPLFWGNAITSTADVRLESDSEVYGDVMGNVTVGKGTVDGSISGPYDADKWPFSEDFSQVYWPQASNATLPDTKCCGGSCILDVAANSTSGIYELGPGFRESDKQEFIVKSTGDNITVTLTGTVYISGDNATLSMGSGGQPFYLDLNNQTIYVEGRNHNLSKPNEHAFFIPPNKVTIMGSGVIIAEGNIDFQPHMEACSENEFVFVMSLFGGVNFQPKGTLYGSVAGRDVEVGSNSVITYTAPPRDPDSGECLLNFPWDAVEHTVRILTWDIS